MTSIFKAKTIISCNTCCCSLPRAKTFKVNATDADAAKIEASEKITSWKNSLVGQNCRVCESIIKDMA